jgi:hypothetical protein
MEKEQSREMFNIDSFRLFNAFDWILFCINKLISHVCVVAEEG